MVLEEIVMKRLEEYSIKGLHFIFLITLAGYLCLYLYAAYKNFIFPFEGKDCAEGNLIYHAIQLLNGKSIYVNCNTQPITSTVYPPVYQVIIAGLIKLFGVKVYLGRLISIIASFLIGWFIYKIVKHETKDFFSSIASTLLFFVFYNVTGQYLDRGRVDTLFLLLSTISLFCIRKYNQGRLFLPAGIIFMILAVYTKQQAVFAIISSFIYLFLQNKRIAIISFISFVVPVGLIFIIINIQTNGLFYFYLIELSRKIPLIPSKILYIKYFIESCPIVLGVIITYIIYSIYYRRDILLSLWVLSLSVAIPLSFLPLINTGGAQNALLPLVLIICILFGIIFNHFQIAIKDKNYAGFLKISLMFILIIQMTMFFYTPQVPTKIDYCNGKKIFDYIAKADGDVFIDRCSSFVFMNNKKVYDDITFIHDVNLAGLWNPCRLLKEINTKRFALILIVDKSYEPKDGPQVFPLLKEAILNNYELIDQIDPQGSKMSRAYKIFKPVRTKSGDK